MRFRVEVPRESVNSSKSFSDREGFGVEVVVWEVRLDFVKEEEEGGVGGMCVEVSVITCTVRDFDLGLDFDGAIAGIDEEGEDSGVRFRFFLFPSASASILPCCCCPLSGWMRSFFFFLSLLIFPSPSASL